MSPPGGERTSRRAVLRGLLAVATTGLAGCPRQAALPRVAGVVGDPVRLGWRWTPGMRHTWRTRVTRTLDASTSWREEVWTYLATDLDPSGIARLEGELVALEIGGTARDDAMPDAVAAALRREALDEAPGAVELSLRLTGGLVGAPPGSFGLAWPHLLLGGVLPIDPTRPGAAWDDPTLALPFAALAPAALPVRVEASTRLEALQDDVSGLVADLTHAATIRTVDGGPVIRLRGQTRFATWPGHLAAREVHVSVAPDDALSGPRIGTLSAAVHLVPERVAT